MYLRHWCSRISHGAKLIQIQDQEEVVLSSGTFTLTQINCDTYATYVSCG